MGLPDGVKDMTKSKLLSAALVAAAMFATPAVARTNHVALRHGVIVHPSHVEAIPGRYKFPSYAPTAPQQNRNLDPSNYGGDVSPEVLEPIRRQ
jgi:hypothetical protein